jgi:hypothetical protein
MFSVSGSSDSEMSGVWRIPVEEVGGLRIRLFQKRDTDAETRSENNPIPRSEFEVYKTASHENQNF